MARAISCIRSVPAGLRSNQIVSPAPYATPIPAQISANSTAWSLKKFTSLLFPHKVGADRVGTRSPVATAREPIRSEAALGRGSRSLGVRELHVRDQLLEVAHHLVRHRFLQHRHQCPQRLD